MSARFFPQSRFLPNRVEIDVFVVRQFDGDFFRDEVRFFFRQPDFAETAFSELADERVKSDFLPCLKPFPRLNYKLKPKSLENLPSEILRNQFERAIVAIRNIKMPVVEFFVKVRNAEIL